MSRPARHRDGRAQARGRHAAERIALASLCLLGVLAIACADHQAQVRSAGAAEGDSHSEEHHLDVPESATSVRFQLDLETETGGIGWIVTDPLGEVREAGNAIDGGDLTRELTFDPIRGDWRLSLSFDGARGTYSFALRASW